MRKILQYLLKKPLTWLGNYLAAAPKKEIVFNSLSELYQSLDDQKSGRLKVLEVDPATDKFIVFSDQHKGNKSWADDFKASEINYLAALNHYHREGYYFINLGDSEELWKFKMEEILQSNENTLITEALFHPARYVKTFGNHDIVWKNKLDIILRLKKYFSMPLPIYEGVVLKLKNIPVPLNIFLTHGHQGDLLSDNNSFSTWVVAHIWMPLQRYLRININAPSKDFSLRNAHNKMMHDWSSQRKNLLLITGHTHVPVFASGRYFEHPSNKIDTKVPQDIAKPCYFNTGCCCFADGDITGIEIAGGYIRLVKWYDEEVVTKKKVLEEIEITRLLSDMDG